MSNESILVRLEEALENLRAGQMTAKEFASFFRFNIEALEAIPYKTLTTARELEYRIEVAEFADEMESLDDLADVMDQVQAFIETLKR